jgi:hypothetical protein
MYPFKGSRKWSGHLMYPLKTFVKSFVHQSAIKYNPKGLFSQTKNPLQKDLPKNLKDLTWSFSPWQLFVRGF